MPAARSLGWYYNNDPDIAIYLYLIALSPHGFRGLRGFVAAIATYVALAEGGCWYPSLRFVVLRVHV